MQSEKEREKKDHQGFRFFFFLNFSKSEEEEKQKNNEITTCNFLLKNGFCREWWPSSRANVRRRNKKKERKGPIRNDLITVRAGGKTLPSALHITV
jgi:hypothetical protein